MKAAPKIAGDERLRQPFEEHLEETEGQEESVRERLRALGADPSKAKDAAGRAGAWGMVLFALAQPDTPGKLVAHSFSYEQMEYAAYALLARYADSVGDEATRSMAGRIGSQKKRMAERLEALFDVASDASQSGEGPAARDGEVDTYLSDSHALESQSLQLLEVAPRMVSDGQLAGLYRRHLKETRGQESAVRSRLAARDSSPSRLKDAALRAAALNIGAFFRFQPDTTLKLSGFSFAFENLEYASYRLLRRVAERAGDRETVALAEDLAGEESATAAAIAATWDGIAAAQLAAVAA